MGGTKVIVDNPTLFPEILEGAPQSKLEACSTSCITVSYIDLRSVRPLPCFVRAVDRRRWP